MPIQTPLDVNPYFDDFDPSKQYYLVLFKPGVAVQARELNFLQSVLQNQIEQFGDNIFHTGTIITGCNFTFFENYPYIKLVDNDLSGSPLDVSQYVGLNVIDSANLVAQVVNFAAGFESTDPDLNTLYLRYLNSGTSGNAVAFTAGEIVTVYDGNYVVEKVTVNNGSSGFSNSDVVEFISALAVQNTVGGVVFANGSGGSNTFNVGDTVNYVGTSNVRATIASINSSANAAALIINILPLSADLANTNASSLNWTFTPGTTIHNLTTNTTLVVANLIGTSASATLLTDSFGTVQTISIVEPGAGYYIAPSVTIKSATGAYSGLNLTAQNYLLQVQIATVANAVGSGYAFGVTKGVIFQKGYFLYVPQTVVVVDKYDQSPDQVSAGFNSIETIVNSLIDPTLLSNANGAPNFAAPGADRLEIAPTLVIQTSNQVASNSLFFPIVSWSNGQPFSQQPSTAYNAIEVEMAKRMYDGQGNFVTDPFLITSASPNTLVSEVNNFTVVVDPGSGYVQGFKVKTDANFAQTEPKGTTTNTQNNASVSVTYGNYILVNNMGGSFVFDTGAVVSLRDTAGLFVANTTLLSDTPTTIVASGAEIGKARIRSIIYNNGNPGTAGATYRLYLFDVKMNAGMSFANVASIFFTSATATAVADVAYTPAAIQDPTHDTLIFPTGANGSQSLANISYTYRSVLTANSNTSGYFVGTAGGGESFLVSPSLVFDTLLIPQANVIATVSGAGTINVATGSAVVVGTATAFDTALAAGDYIRITDGTAGNTVIKQVLFIANSINLGVDSNVGFTNVSATFKLVLPQNIPVSLITHGRSINISPNNIMTVNLSNTFAASANMNLIYSAYVVNATPIAKSVQRNVFVLLDLSNNAANTVGPWVLGVPDIIRLGHVYRGTSTTATEITSNFYINGGQGSDSIDVGQLVLNQGTSLALSGSDKLLVVFDCLTRASLGGGVVCVNSYPINDSIALANASASMSTLEIPELFDDTGNYYDLRDCLDFRPVSANTAVLASSNATATTNPVVPTAGAKYGNTADPTNNKRFPHPISTANANITYYLGRKDTVVVNPNNNIEYILGTPDIPSKTVPPPPPTGTMTLNTLVVPPYPSIPLALSAQTTLFAATGIVNGRAAGTRRNAFTIQVTVSPSGIATLQPQAFTMKDIEGLREEIQNLEAVVLVLLLQNQVQNANVTTYGFFADDFSSTQYSDLANPSYNATLLNNQLLPRALQLNLPLKNPSPSQYATLPFQNFKLIAQLNATTPNASANTLIPTQVQQELVIPGSPTFSVFPKTIVRVGGNRFAQYAWETFQVEASTTAGPVQLLIDGITGPQKFYIFQSPAALPTLQRQYTSNTALNNPLTTGVWNPYLLTTSDSVVNLTTQQKAMISDNHPNFSLISMPVAVGGTGLRFMGALNWSHDPLNGRFYTILVVKGNFNYKFWMFYPADEPTLITNSSPQPITPVEYNGSMIVHPTTYKIELVTYPASDTLKFKYNANTGGRIYVSK